MREVAVHGQDKRRPMKDVHELRGNDTDDASMPSVPRHHQNASGADGRVGLHQLPGVRENRGFFLPPSRVLAIELPGELTHLIGHALIRCQEQPRRNVGARHPAGRVDTRRNHERHVGAVDGLTRQPCGLEQRAESDPVGAVREHLQPELGNDAVFANQRDHVGKRSDGRDLDECREPALAAPTLADRLHHLQRDADPREVLVWIRTIAPLGIDDGERRGQRWPWLMMVGDDQIDPGLTRPLRGLDRPDSAIDRNHEAHAVVPQAIERLRLQAVAVAHALGDEMLDLGPQQLEETTQDHGGRDPVDVVVAMDDNPFATLDGGEQALDCGRHVRQPEWIVKMVD